jgi:hypothetical protein
MLVDDVYFWLLHRAQEAGYLHLYGQTHYNIVERYADHLNDQIQKLHVGGLLNLARLPSA